MPSEGRCNHIAGCLRPSNNLRGLTPPPLPDFRKVASGCAPESLYVALPDIVVQLGSASRTYDYFDFIQQCAKRGFVQCFFNRFSHKNLKKMKQVSFLFV